MKWTYITEELPSDVVYQQERDLYRVRISLPVGYPTSDPVACFELPANETTQSNVWQDTIIRYAKDIEDIMKCYGFKCLKDWTDEPAPF